MCTVYQRLNLFSTVEWISGPPISLEHCSCTNSQKAPDVALLMLFEKVATFHRHNVTDSAPLLSLVARSVFAVTMPHAVSLLC